MIIPTALLSQFIAVLLATLVGVYTAFFLDRWQQEQQSRQRAIEHLESLKDELKTNMERVEANDKLIRHLQRRESEGDHYTLEPLETDAWLAALEEPILGTISNDVYEQLQQSYSNIKRVNALIERQQDEMYHSSLGDTEKFGGSSYSIWTISVDFFDHDKEEADFTGLGPLIKDEANSLRNIDGLIEELNDEKIRLGEYSLSQHIIYTFFG